MARNGLVRNYMSDKCFFDSNILVYMQDVEEPQKQQISRSLFFECVADNSAFISTQCLQEFYNVVAKKKKLEAKSAKQTIHELSKSLPVIQITPVMIENAIDISVETQFSFWDSLILSAAKSADCNILYSEDLNDGQIIRGVTIKNPFAKVNS